MANLKPVYIDTASGELKEPRSGDTLINDPELTVSSIDGLLTSNLNKSNYPTTQSVYVLNFYSTSIGGGGLFEWDANEPKANHDGGSVINPDHNSTPGDVGWYSSTGNSTDDTGTGCWRRPLDDSILLTWYGIKKGFGKTATVVSQNTAAVQSWINKVSNSTGLGKANYQGVVETNRLYFYYDATNNPDFNSTGTIKVSFEGINSTSKPSVDNNRDDGTILSCVETGDITAFQVGRNTGPFMNSVRFENLVFYGNNSGKVFHVKRVGQSAYINNIFVYQQGTGDGMLVSDAWTGTLSNIFCYGAGSTTSGVGFQHQNLDFTASMLSLYNITGHSFAYGVVEGGLVHNEGKRSLLTKSSAIQGSDCKVGVFFGYNTGTNHVDDIHVEGSTHAGVQFANSCEDIKIDALHVVDRDNNTDGGVVFGLGTVDEFTKFSTQTDGETAVATQNGYKNITINNLFVELVVNNGVKLYASSNALNTTIKKPKFTANTVGVGVGFNLPDAALHGFEIIRPEYTDLATNITNKQRVDLYVNSDTLGTRESRSVLEAHGLDIHSNLKIQHQTVNATTTASENEELIYRIDSSGGAGTFTLPDANVTTGLVFILMKVDSSNNVITVQVGTGDNINARSNITLEDRYESVILRSNGGQYEILSYTQSMATETTMAEDGVTASASYTQSELQAALDKIDDIITRFRKITP